MMNHIELQNQKKSIFNEKHWIISKILTKIVVVSFFLTYLPITVVVFAIDDFAPIRGEQVADIGTCRDQHRTHGEQL